LLTELSTDDAVASFTEKQAKNTALASQI
jgi:hypothetical protein